MHWGQAKIGLDDINSFCLLPLDILDTFFNITNYSNILAKMEKE